MRGRTTLGEKKANVKWRFAQKSLLRTLFHIAALCFSGLRL